MDLAMLADLRSLYLTLLNWLGATERQRGVVFICGSQQWAGQARGDSKVTDCPGDWNLG